MEYVPDNYQAFEEHERHLSEMEEEILFCHWCNNLVESDIYYEINGNIVCEDCIDGCRRYA